MYTSYPYFKRFYKSFQYSIIAIALLFSINSCDKEEETNTLIVSKRVVEIPANGGQVTFTLETDADSWRIQNPASDWIVISPMTGTSSKEEITIDVDSKTLEGRRDTIYITAGNAPDNKVIITQEASLYQYDLQVDKEQLSFNNSAGEMVFNITSETADWNISNEASWLSLSKVNGGIGTYAITVSVPENIESAERTATITLSGESAPSIEIEITQQDIYPSFNINRLAPDENGMSSSAQEIASRINIGWNIGNTLEAIGGETAWGNPQVTNELIQLVKQNGFNAIRVPCSWNQYVENSLTAKISTEWLNRVKQVVEYCVDNEIYVFLNIHWDGGWLENNCTPEKQVENNAKQKAFWEQIATHLRDFDEHLIFAGANEPNVENATQMEVLMSYHQTFIDAVRSTGGKNSYRVLVVQGPFTDIEKTNSLMTAMPNDYVADRLMAEIHYYTPYQFCLMTEDANWGDMFYYWGEGYHSNIYSDRNATWGEEDTIDDFLRRMKTQFVDKGIPVIMGEFAAIKRSLSVGDQALHEASRLYYLKYLMQQSKVNGILPFYWDAGNMGDNSSALFNRHTNTVYDQEAINALMEGIQ